MEKKKIYLFLAAVALVWLGICLYFKPPATFMLLQGGLIGLFFVLTHFYFLPQPPSLEGEFKSGKTLRCPSCGANNHIRSMVHTFWIRNISPGWRTWACANCGKKLTVTLQSRKKVRMVFFPVTLVLFLFCIHLIKTRTVNVPAEIMVAAGIAAGLFLLSFLAYRFAVLETAPDDRQT